MSALDISVSNQLILSLFKRMEKLENKLDAILSRLETKAETQQVPFSMSYGAILPTPKNNDGEKSTVSTPLACVRTLSRTSSRTSLCEQEDSWTVLGDYPHNK